MGTRSHPAVYTIPAHRGFADALATRLVADFGGGPRGMADCLILIPNNRAGRALTEAFVRRAEDGLLLPRMAAVGDLDLGESLGSALEPLGLGPDISPAISPLPRQLLLAGLVQRLYRDTSGNSINAAEALRLAGDLAQVIDQMQVEEKSLKALVDFDVGDLAQHWQVSSELFSALAGEWPKLLAERGLIDPAHRRNLMLDHVRTKWTESRPNQPIIAAGISTSAPAIARLLRCVSELPNGMTVLPHLDLAMPAEDWDALGPHKPDPDTGYKQRDMETHPQYHLKLLLDRMGVNRDEVRRWTRSGESDAPAIRSHVISTAFALPERTADWIDVPSEKRRLTGVTLLEAADGHEEALAIAIAVRRELEESGKRISIITANRALAQRISAHLKRWNIDADDSAGTPLPQTPQGAFLILMLEAAAVRFAPVELLQLLKHPIAAPLLGDDENERSERRLNWLDMVRNLDLALRGPRPNAGLSGVEAAIAAAMIDRYKTADDAVLGWWRTLAKLLQPLETLSDLPFSDALDRITTLADSLSGGAVWQHQPGRDLAALIEQLRMCAPDGPRGLPVDEWPAWLQEILAQQSVRPQWGGHPRVAIYGLLEARLQQADLVICAGLNEGSWPQISAPDPWLAPAIRRQLGLPALERNIGLSAHDLASAMGANKLLLTRAERDDGSPAIPSRFLLRLNALAGVDGMQRDTELVQFARLLDRPNTVCAADRPAPSPPVERRRVSLSVTNLDGLRADPYSFYAQKILRLSALEKVDAEPDSRWRGNMVHDVLEQWALHDGLDPEKLLARGKAMLVQLSAHPLMRVLWEPRLMEPLEFIGAEITKNLQANRRPVIIEGNGEIELDGVRMKGRADRIDLNTDGGLVIVDYKTGKAPSQAQVKAGFAMQLGLLGYIAEQRGFQVDEKTPLVKGEASGFEYWSFAKNSSGPNKGKLGNVRHAASDDPKMKALGKDEMVDTCLRFAREAIAEYILGDAPFIAKKYPQYAPYQEYHQLMRYDEWSERTEDVAAEKSLEGGANG